jgi:hypothetical protein
LACLFVLNIASPHLWFNVERPDSKLDPSPTEQATVALKFEQAKQETPKCPGGEAAGRRKGEVVVLRPVSHSESDATPEIAPPILHDKLLADSQPQEKTPSTDGTKPPLPGDTEDIVDTTGPEIAGSVVVEPSGKIGTMTIDVVKETDEAVGRSTSEPVKPPQRLPLVVANVPSQTHASPHDTVLFPDELRSPKTDPSPSISNSEKSRRHRDERNVDDRWQEPKTLLERLNGLATIGATGKWASETIRQIEELNTAMAKDAKEATAVLDRLAALNDQIATLAAKISDRTLARNLKKTGCDLNRRIDVWRVVVRLAEPRPVANAGFEIDPQKLAMCLAKVDILTSDSEEGKAWRDYLLIDALKETAKRQPSFEEKATQQIAKEVTTRLTQTPLTSRQQQFVTTGAVAALREELRRWAAEPVGAATLLRDIEAYERTSLPSDAKRLARDCQNLALSSNENRRQLAEQVDVHYRNANMRLAITEELINQVIPERNLEYALVDDTVLNRPVKGESLMATELTVRMTPDPHHVRMTLEVKGEISAATTADAGLARFHNDSESSYVARKPLQIDMSGVSVWPSEVGVENDTHLTGVDTPLDWVPLIGSVARGVARSQSDQNKSAATEEVKQKIAAQASQRVDDEARQRLGEFVERINQRVFDPLNALSLDPQLIDAETTDKRFTMRLRLAGEDQLGSHTPRPQAPDDSLASVQIHESVLNNGIQRLQLDGRTFDLAELSKHIADRLSRPVSWEVNPEHSDVKITFAPKDAVIVRCENDRIVLTLSVVELSKGSRKWKNFQIRAYYKPEIEGRSAQLVRDGVVQLIGRLNMGSQIALRGIFSRALSKNNSWELIPPQIVKEPKLSDSAVTQFVIDDGWIAVALGPKRLSATTAHKQRGSVR